MQIEWLRLKLIGLHSLGHRQKCGMEDSENTKGRKEERMREQTMNKTRLLNFVLIIVVTIQ